MPYTCNIPAHIPHMINDIPAEDQPKDDQMALLWKVIAIELGDLILYGSQANNPQIVLSTFRKSGDQYIAEFSVSDLDIARKESYNFHGQNTSQWLYAGAIVIQDGKVSRHH